MRPVPRALRWARCRGDRGATSAEYALIAALIAVVIVAAVTYFGVALASSWSDSADQIDSATNP